jgi:hypothetical protein
LVQVRGWVSDAFGGGNTFIGADTGHQNIEFDNTFIGVEAGYSNTAGSDNVFLGYQAGLGETGSN